MMQLNIAGRIGLLLAVAGAALLGVEGCSYDSPWGGGFQVVPLGADPPIGPYFSPSTINGQCFLTDGYWCLPCNGGPTFPCSLYMLSNVGPSGRVEPIFPSPPVTPPPGLMPARPLQPQFLEFTGGLDGEAYQANIGLHRWQPGAPVTLPMRVNGMTPDPDMLDVSFLWRSDWARPASTPATAITAYVDGDFSDQTPDLMLIRIVGPAGSVRAALSGLASEGVVWLDNGTAWMF